MNRKEIKKLRKSKIKFEMEKRRSQGKSIVIGFLTHVNIVKSKNLERKITVAKPIKQVKKCNKSRRTYYHEYFTFDNFDGSIG